MFKRYEGNPILNPLKEHKWEACMVFNCAVVYEQEKVHIVYRGRESHNGISKFGYASSKDGFHIDERLEEPIFDITGDVDCLGVEDPRITRMGDRYYMTYTPYGRWSRMVPERKEVQIAIASISVNDFLNKRWNWSERTYPLFRVDNKNCVIFSEKINGKYVLYFRIPPHIWIGYSDDLRNIYDCKIIMSPEQEWEYFKIGAGAPPIKTEKGWLFIYHGVDAHHYYRLGLMFIDLENPEKVIKRWKEPILEPEKEYEEQGIVSNVVYTCGAVKIGNRIFLYYGGADTVICVATAELSDILSQV